MVRVMAIFLACLVMHGHRVRVMKFFIQFHHDCKQGQVYFFKLFFEGKGNQKPIEKTKVYLKAGSH